MRCTVAVTVITFVCLFALFHSCQGIICYLCNSMNYDKKTCEHISGDEFIHDYGDKVDQCMRILLTKNNSKNVTTERLLRRSGNEYGEQKDFEKNINFLKSRRYKVDIFTCKEDKCNGN